MDDKVKKRKNFLKEHIFIRRVVKYSKTLIKWLMLSLLIGLCCGIVGSLFRYATEWACDVFNINRFFIYILPFAGLAIVWLYKLAFKDKTSDTNLVLKSLRTHDSLPIVMAPLIFIGTVVTHIYGGSSGKEGAALQMGGSIGSFIATKLKLSKNGKRIMMMAGMSSLFATFFQTPLTATIFSMEVIDVGVMHYSALMPSIIASMFAIYISQLFGLSELRFKNIIIPDMNVNNILGVIILGCLCAIISVIFCNLLHIANELFKRLLKNEYARIFFGGCIIIVLTLFVGNGRYNGAGGNIISEALTGDILNSDWIYKMIFTIVTLESGFKGGEILPTFVIGSAFGNFFGKLIGMDKNFMAAVGLVALFCGVVNCPITALILSIELFGSEGLIFFALASSLSYILSGYSSLYQSQNILYSKMESEKNKDRVVIKNAQ